MNQRLDRLFWLKTLLAFFMAASAPALAQAYDVQSDAASEPVADIVNRILPYTDISKDTQVVVMANTLVESFMIMEADNTLQIFYRQGFAEEIKRAPFVALDIWMLLTFHFAEHIGEYKSYFLGLVLAVEGFSRDQIKFYSEEIRKRGIDWLNEEEMNELFYEHQWIRMELLSPAMPEEEIALAEPEPIVEDPDLGAGAPATPEEEEPVVQAPPVPVEEAPVLEAPVVVEAAPVSEMDGDPNNSVVKVYYATNRKKQPPIDGSPEGWTDPNEFYGGLREDGDKVNYGYTLVNIPKIHQKGVVERPSVVRLEFWREPVENPDKHIMLTKIEELDKDNYFAQLKEESKKVKTAFVFVHGFNVTFASAARVTAQLSFDSEYKGTPILFSWPSDGTLLNPTSYIADQTDAKLGGHKLKDFLFDLVREGGYEAINLVAHSMGNLAMTEALSLFEREMPRQLTEMFAAEQKPFKELVMYAPDVDVDLFELNRDYIRNVVEHTSVYASNNDKAINFSSSIRQAPRLGGYVVNFENGNPNTCREGLMYSAEGIDSIDATDVNLGLFSPLNHSYYSEYNFVTDFGKLLSGKERMRNPKNRGLGRQIVHEHNGVEYRYWGFIPCD